MAKIYASTNPDISERELRNAERSQNIAAMGMVLLENYGGLPLKVSDNKIALFGNGARNTVKGGTGSGEVNGRKALSIEEAFEEAGFQVTTSTWMDRYDTVIEDARKIYYGNLQKKIAIEGMSAVMDVFNHPFKEPSVILATEEELKQEVHAAIYVVARNSGEGADRNPGQGDFKLFAEEIALLEQVTKTYDHVIVVLNVGGVMDTSYFKNNEKIKSVLLMSQAGVNGAKALVEVITGAATPSGHLTATWAARYEDYPSSDSFSHMNGDVNDEYYNEGIYVGYRYFDTFNVTPNYPFGYGLSYTTFEMETLRVNANEQEVTLNVRVTNTGNTYSGRHVVQVYTSAPAGKLEKPYQALAAFAKTKELAPGEAQELSLSFATVDMASYDTEQAAWILEKGDYIIRTGSDSRSTKVVAKLRLMDNSMVRKLSNRLPLDCGLEVKSSRGIAAYTYETEKAEVQEAETIILDAKKIPCETAVYEEARAAIPSTITEMISMEDIKSKKATLEELVSQLTVAEMAELCIGTSRGGFGGSSIIGAASNAVPGAAGDTSSILLESRGVANLILADGPAGLRLSSDFIADKDSNIIPGTEKAPISGFEFLKGQQPKPEIPEDAITYYQYATAIPIATLLAQTWDMEALENAGDLVGEEMEEFGVHLWLAPGMNIHRNPLCGRNFEYYSEDPLMSGKCAAADTMGVQKHKGCGTTIKHFACNNQEDNRQHTNAHVSERALREIYLKGFEIAVKESQPKSIMTSYNLLNGIHTANNYDLITAIARQEWGFSGVVMTDWGTTGGMEMLKSNEAFKYGNSSAAGCIKAGNDLIMPGKQEDLDEIIRSVGAEEGTEGVVCPITLSELQDCALHVLRAAMESGELKTV